MRFGCLLYLFCEDFVGNGIWWDDYCGFESCIQCVFQAVEEQGCCCEVKGEEEVVCEKPWDEE